MSIQPQTALVEQAQRGDVEAYEILARDAAHRLHPVALHLLRDPDLADDALQQTLVTIWHQLGQLRDADRFDGWSYRLLVRFCMRELRARKRFAGGVDEGDVPSRGADASAEIADRDQLERALRRLSLDHRAVVGLVYYRGLSGPEAAEMLGVSPGTVASRLHYALRGMRAALEADSRPTLAVA